MTAYLWAAFYLFTRRLGRIDHVIEVQNGMPFLATLFTRAKVTVLVHHVHREQWPVVGFLLSMIGWFMESQAAPRVNRNNDYAAVSQMTTAAVVELAVDERRIPSASKGVRPVPEFENPGRDEHPSLVALSRLVPHKLIEHAIQTLHDLRNECPATTLAIRGDGWWTDH